MLEDVFEQRQIQPGPAIGCGQTDVDAAEPPPVAAQPQLSQHRRPGLLDADPGGAGEMLAEHGAVATLGSGVEDPAEAAQLVAQAQYERAIQSAFRDTADALVGLATWRDQLAAQREQRDAARETARLTELKAAQGAASVLERLDAQRALWAAEQSVVQVRLAELANRVALYKALGG